MVAQKSRVNVLCIITKVTRTRYPIQLPTYLKVKSVVKVSDRRGDGDKLPEPHSRPSGSKKKGQKDAPQLTLRCSG